MVQSPVTVTASTPSGLPITFTTSTPTVCTAGGSNGSTITLVAPGACTVLADQAGNGIYAAATQRTRTFTVNLTSRDDVPLLLHQPRRDAPASPR